MNVDTIKDQLRSLRLPQASLMLETILEKRKTKTEISWLSLLLEAELDQRKDNAVEKESRAQAFLSAEASSSSIGVLTKSARASKSKNYLI